MPRYLQSMSRTRDRKPSSPLPQIPSRQRITAAQTAELQKLKPYLERRYFVNATVLSKCHPCPPGFAAAREKSSAGESLPDQPITIHTLSVPEYQSLYHSVVNLNLVKSTGKPRPYYMALGLHIKQRLWDKLRCPSVKEVEQEHFDINNRRTAALRALPVYLREDDSVFFKTWNTEEMEEPDIADSAVALLSMVNGDSRSTVQFDPAGIAIVLEDQTGAVS
ncbi:hypothetical protein KOW79_019413 [Hemibagrus wyckioides]|uniref:Uncharacterized protein n=1 Tax=Hemibagrus wyckioides TaxID=337641 RepID=A0A9D3N9S1_9TELE|nr:hypothetical protein KOW79_019413 [Hemibagrus wyckioides]